MSSPGVLNELFSLEGKTALLTGTGGGIGHALGLGGRAVCLTGDDHHGLPRLGGVFPRVARAPRAGQGPLPLGTEVDMWEGPAVIRGMAESPGKLHKAVFVRG